MKENEVKKKSEKGLQRERERDLLKWNSTVTIPLRYILIESRPISVINHRVTGV